MTNKKPVGIRCPIRSLLVGKCPIRSLFAKVSNTEPVCRRKVSNKKPFCRKVSNKKLAGSRCSWHTNIGCLTYDSMCVFLYTRPFKRYMQIFWIYLSGGCFAFWKLKERLALYLKGQCHEIFCFWFFSWISFPLGPEYTIGAVSNFSKIRGDIRSSRLTTGINDTGGKQWDWYQAADTFKWTWGQKCIYVWTLLYYPKVSQQNY